MFLIHRWLYVASREFKKKKKAHPKLKPKWQVSTAIFGNLF